MNKPKPTKKGQRGTPRKNNPKHPSHELDNDVGHEVENLPEEQDSNISEEQDEIEGGQDEANTTIRSNSGGSSKPPPDIASLYGLDRNQIYSVTTDNGSNMVKAVQLMNDNNSGNNVNNNDEDYDEEIYYEGDDQHS
ncbi:hypothetical protein GHT06_018643 [Daphnia sinensis]|uniref:Uncharacterized protein n=1 Tax=Daphnia sinensis TaxID=1820382 RepID=A0AAD5L4V1_9CRUS|nr:hypothetical protein GHT06_018643 [Daphnia sinensis]